MRVIIRWFCLCMLILFFVFSISDIQTTDQKDLSVVKMPILDVDQDVESIQKHANSQFVVKRNN